MFMMMAMIFIMILTNMPLITHNYECFMLTIMIVMIVMIVMIMMMMMMVMMMLICIVILIVVLILLSQFLLLWL